MGRSHKGYQATTRVLTGLDENVSAISGQQRVGRARAESRKIPQSQGYKTKMEISSMMVASIFFEGITQKDVLVSVLFCLFWAFALNENQLKKWSTYAVLLYIALMVTFILIDGDGALFMIVKWSGLILWNAFPSIVENWRKSKSDGLSTLVYIGGLGLITGALLALSQKLGEWNIGYDIL